MDSGERIETKPPELPTDPEQRKPHNAYPVVGIGASAGGLEALMQLFSTLRPDAGMSFLVVQHLDPHHPSRLTELLARATTMTVLEATNGKKVAPNTVYVIPPNVSMAIAQGALHLKARGDARVWSSFPASGSRIPGVTTTHSFPSARLMPGSSRADATTPFIPASRAMRASDTTVSSTRRLAPKVAFHSSSLKWVSTVTATRIALAPPLASADSRAARSMVGPPEACSVIMSAPITMAFRTAPCTVLGMS
jgi:hypothetical protein